MTRRLMALAVPAVALVFLLGGTAVAGVAAPAAHRASCAEHWGSKAKSAGVMVQTRIRAIRAGRHACFDRLVIDLGKGNRPGYRVRYVKRIIQDPSGKVIPVRGKGKLSIVVLAPVRRGFPINSRHLVNVNGFRTFRQVVGAGSFEGITSFGLGVRARLPFRVLRIKQATGAWSVVVDVAHRWPS